MTYALFSVPFQGKRVDIGPVLPAEGMEAQVNAFPRTPARDAQTDPAYRAFKITSLTSRALLFSAVRNRGESDAFGRPVLHANGCILRAEELLGPERDPVAVLMALDNWSDQEGEPAFAQKLSAASAWDDDTAFEAMRSRLSADPQFHAEAAFAVMEPRVTLSWAPGEAILPMLQPVLALLSAGQLVHLDLATGAADANHREAVLGIAGPDEGVHSGTGGFLSQLLGRRRELRIDFRHRAVTGSRGPRELVDAISAPADWPGFTPRERYRLLLLCLDAGAMPPEAAVLPDDAQRTLRHIEALGRRLGEGR